MTSLAHVAPIRFYLAHGAADSCGPGCSEWIAAEGKIDAHATDRLQLLLRKLPDPKPPIVFHSPGGLALESLRLGRLIRKNKLDTSIGHTVLAGCDSVKPDQPCAAQANSGKPAEYEISQFVSQCNSGCVYALAGGVNHLVPPWVKLGIHDAGLDPDSKLPRGPLLATALGSIHERIRAYLREMGIEASLLAATEAIPYEAPKFLRRDDIARYGLDRREVGETAWQFANLTPAQMRKRFFVRVDGEPPHYVNGFVQIGCAALGNMSLGFAREALPSDPDLVRTTPARISIAFGGKQIALGRGTLPNFYVRAGTVSSLDSLKETTVELPGPELGRTERGAVTLNMEGFSTAYATLRDHCLPPQKGLQAMVQQLQVKPGQYGFGTQASSWTASAMPATGKTTPTIQFRRFAATEQKLRLDFLFLLKPDCSSFGKQAVTVIEQPQHGTLSIEDDHGMSDFPQSDQRAVCNAHNADAVAVFYKPNGDFRGTDSAAVTIAASPGSAVTHRYAIEVK